LRHFGSGSGADEASSSMRGCEGVESVLKSEKKLMERLYKGEDDDDKNTQ
jgi:hypothetical protein